jgi:hypothetical protein
MKADTTSLPIQNGNVLMQSDLLFSVRHAGQKNLSGAGTFMVNLVETTPCNFTLPVKESEQ